MPVNFGNPFAKPAKTPIHVPDPIEPERPRSEQPLPLDRRNSA